MALPPADYGQVGRRRQIAAVGLGEVPVADAYGPTRDGALANFVNNLVAGVVQRLVYGPSAG